MFEDIAREIRSASGEHRKTATIQLQVLLHADLLKDISGAEFCERVGIEPSWKTAYRDMLTLSSLMSDKGVSIIASK